jgi:phage terminase large subunit-like protein
MVDKFSGRRYELLGEEGKGAIRRVIGDYPLSKLTVEEFDKIFMEVCREESIYYEPHRKQLEFHGAGILAKQRMFLAANRSGKTFCGCYEVACHLTGRYPLWWNGYRYKRGIKVWVLSKTSSVVRDTLQRYFFDGFSTISLVDRSLVRRIERRSGVSGAYDRVFVGHISGGESCIEFKSYDQGRDSLQSMTVDVVLMDEEPVDYGVYTECLTRLMGTSEYHHGMMLLTMTPLHGYTDLVRGFLDIGQGEVVDGRWWCGATWEDNPHLSEVDKKELIKSYRVHEIEARTMGVPSLGSGMVYPISEGMVLCDPFEIPDYWPRVYGLDFGWTAPTAALFGAHDRDNDVIYFYAEYAIPELTPQVHAVNLLRMGADVIPGVYDPAGLQSGIRDGEKLAVVYRDVGLRLLSKADNAKEAGIARVLTRMQNGQLKIFRTLGKALTELRMYARDEEGIVRKGNDHLMDCMRYVVMSGLGVARCRVVEGEIGLRGGGYL